MKRYLLFYGSTYYPSGGIEDFINSFDNLKDAENAVIKQLNKDERILDCGGYKVLDNYTWFHIFDSKKNTIIRNSYFMLFKRLNLDIKIEA